MHHRRPISSATTAAAAISIPAAAAAASSISATSSSRNGDHPQSHATSAVNGNGGIAAATNVPMRKRRRRVTRKNSNDDLHCLMALVGIVAVLIVVCLILVFYLWRSSGYSITTPTTTGDVPHGDPMRQGQQRPPKPSRQRQSQFPDLPPHPIYTIPHSMSHIGDRSAAYATLRKAYDAQFPYDPERSLQSLASIRNHHRFSTVDVPYDVYNCPDVPPPGYPHEWKTLDILQAWNPDNTTIPHKLFQGICVFDYRKDYVKALVYRQAELPFVVTGDPDVAQAVERWNTPHYLSELMGTQIHHRAELSKTNHFMYWVPGDATKQQRKITHNTPPQKDWQAPTSMIRMTFPEFLVRANTTTIESDQAHWYFRLIGCGETGPTGDCDAGSSEWLFDELTFFQPRPNLLYLVEPSQQRGIHCRFGMKGVTIANHFDTSRNAIVVLGGERRYILSHPKHCSNLALYPKGHPSARHSAVDWSRPLEYLEEYPEFAQAYSNEVVLQAGDVLYLPTNWFHYIVSLGLNYQCNTRSGTSQEYMPPIKECGF